MRSIAMFILVLSASFSCQQDPFAGLNQLTGDWKVHASRGVTFESWKNVSAKEMYGHSYKLNGKDTITFENTRLAKLDEGIFYIPIVANENNGRPVSFRLISSTDHKYIFENKEHDFPQRIVYHLITKDSVHAWIEGTQNGKEGRADYYFSRIR